MGPSHYLPSRSSTSELALSGKKRIDFGDFLSILAKNYCTGDSDAAVELKDAFKYDPPSNYCYSLLYKHLSTIFSPLFLIHFQPSPITNAFVIFPKRASFIHSINPNNALQNSTASKHCWDFIMWKMLQRRSGAMLCLICGRRNCVFKIQITDERGILCLACTQLK